MNNWPQISEYQENGITIRVFKSAFVETRESPYSAPVSPTDILPTNSARNDQAISAFIFGRKGKRLIPHKRDVK